MWSTCDSINLAPNTQTCDMTCPHPLTSVESYFTWIKLHRLVRVCCMILCPSCRPGPVHSYRVIGTAWHDNIGGSVPPGFFFLRVGAALLCCPYSRCLLAAVDDISGLGSSICDVHDTHTHTHTHGQTSPGNAVICEWIPVECEGSGLSPGCLQGDVDAFGSPVSYQSQS